MPSVNPLFGTAKVDEKPKQDPLFTAKADPLFGSTVKSSMVVTPTKTTQSSQPLSSDELLTGVPPLTIGQQLGLDPDPYAEYRGYSKYPPTPESRSVLGELGASALNSADRILAAPRALLLNDPLPPDPDLAPSPPPEDAGSFRKFAHEAAQVIGGSVPYIGGMLVGGPLLAAVMGLVEGAANASERTHGDTQATLEGAVTGFVFNYLDPLIWANKVPGVRGVINKAVERFGAGPVTKYIAGLGANAALGGGLGTVQAYTTENIVKRGGGEAQEVDPVHAFFVNAGAVGTIHGLFNAPKLKKDIDFSSQRKRFVDAGIVSKEENALIGDRPGVFMKLLVDRVSNNDVSIVQKRDAEGTLLFNKNRQADIEFVSKPDVVTPAEKAELLYNKEFIDAYRNWVSKGGERIFTESSRLPPTKEDLVELRSELTKLREEITPKLNLDDVTASNLPATKRGLVFRDIGVMLAKLDQGVGTRQVFDQARSLLEYAKNLKDPDTKLSVDTALRSKDTDEILSPINLRKVSTLPLLMPNAERAGYLRRATEIVERPKVQEDIRKLQRRMIQEMLVLRKKSELSPAQKFTMMMLLDNVYTERVKTLVDKDNNQPRAVKSKVAQKVKESTTIPDELKPKIIQALDNKIEDIARSAVDETQRGTIEKLLDDVDNVYNVPTSDLGLQVKEHTVALLKDLHAAMTQDPKFLPWGEKVQKARTELVQKLKDLAGYELESGRAALVESIKALPPEYARPLLEKISGVKSQADLLAFGSDIANAYNTYLRESHTSKLLDLVQSKSLLKNSQRDAVYKLILALEPTPKAESVEHITQVAIQFDGRTYVGKATDTHADVYKLVERRIKGDKAKLKQFIDEFNNNDQIRGFVTSKKRFVNRSDGFEIAKVANQIRDVDLKNAKDTGLLEPKMLQSDTPNAPKSKLLTTNEETSYIEVNVKELEKKLDTLSTDRLMFLTKQVQKAVREGKLQAGLDRKYMKFSISENKANVLKVLAKSKDRSSLKERYDTTRHNVGLFGDPVTYIGWLEQTAKWNPDNAFLKIMSTNMIKPMDRHLANEANVQRFQAQIAKNILGFNTETVVGQYRLAKYLRETLPSGLTRDQAMDIYALTQDPSRRALLAKYGVTANDKLYDPKLPENTKPENVEDGKIAKLLEGLTPKDKEYVNRTKSYLYNNAVVEKAFSNHALLNGYTPNRVANWWTSVRNPEKTRVEPDFGTFTTTLFNSIDPLKERAEGTSSPFDVNDGFSSKFATVSSRISLYAEMAKDLYQAQSLMTDAEIKSEMIRKFGKARVQSLELYLSNIYGQVGHLSTAFDEFVNKTTTGASVAMTALNVGSAAKQFLNVFTLAADGKVRLASVGKAVASNAWVDRAIDRAMQESSGLAYQRYHGRYFQNVLVLGESNRLPNKLDVVQHYSMVLQREADRATMRIAFKAAQDEMFRKGYRGKMLREKTADLFTEIIGRDQPTDNPLYASELEVIAKRQPLARAALMFKRETNRLYNVVRRHVVRAVEEPSAENAYRAGKALLLGVVGNALGGVLIDSARRAAFGKPTTEEDVIVGGLSNMVGMYYLAIPVDVAIRGFFDPMRQNPDQLLGPLGNLGYNGARLAWSLGNAAMAGDEKIRSGVYRGASKQDRELGKAADAALRLIGQTTGLPFWALWYQGKGLYNWTQDDYRLMYLYEVEKARLKADGREGGYRFGELEQAGKKINEIHRMREAGLIGENTARKEVARELRSVVR